MKGPFSATEDLSSARQKTASTRQDMVDGERFPKDGRTRVVIEKVAPWVDGGQFPVKRTVGESVHVEADVFADGHDQVTAILRHRAGLSGAWHEVEMRPLANDRWAGEFQVHTTGSHEFTILGWIDRFATWRHDLHKRVEAGQDVGTDLAIGAQIVEDAAGQADGTTARTLAAFSELLRSGEQAEAIELAMSSSLEMLMRRHAPRRFAAELSSPVRLWVDRPKARFSAWYELFPRSASPQPGRHGTLRDVEDRLDAIAEMGFNVLYLPPIHPIGRTFRKGRNNAPEVKPGDVGSPWAIGSQEGGHDAIHPDLGSFEDFDHLVQAAADCGIELALDLAFQCSADHPYVREHPEWFRHRPDGTIQYAENPPKKYQDIYPLDFEGEHWESLWNELLRIVLFWHGHGVRIFRVDNPHTKPFRFWEWLIARVREHDPNVLFLAEAFTRPKVMYRLAKLGFSQSYTYFTWRNDPWSLRQYITEVTTPPVADFFRANLWPNTPDILNEYLQNGGQAAFVIRAILAATLGANYGIYGPAFELMEHAAVRSGSEEYLDSEKYQVRSWDLDRPDSLRELLTRLNRIRRDNPALQHDRMLHFHACDNPSVICYSKRHGDNAVLVALNTDPYQPQWSQIALNLEAMGVTEDTPFQMHDLLTDARYRWQGNRAVVGLDPRSGPAHVFVVRRRTRTEADFEYFM